jgi:hypothetical protein
MQQFHALIQFFRRFLKTQWLLLVGMLGVLGALVWLAHLGHWNREQIFSAEAIQTIVLVCIPLLVVALARTWRDREGKVPALSVQTTVHLLTFFILVLAIYSSALVDPQSSATDTFHRTKEMAAILLLFVLSELAALIFEQIIVVDQRSTDTTSTLARVSYILERSIDSMNALLAFEKLHPEARDPLMKLCENYTRLSPVGELGKRDDSTSLALRTLVSTYLREEHKDITAKIRLEAYSSAIAVPASVNLPQIIGRPGDHSGDELHYFATNVGFYATMLSKLLSTLSIHCNNELVDERVCMAVITNVLPVHWWDWPMTDKVWHSYEPIEAYRRAQNEAVQNGGRIDRLVLLSDDKDGKERHGPLWTRSFAAEVETLFVSVKNAAPPSLHSVPINAEVDWKDDCFRYVKAAAKDPLVDKGATRVYPLYSASKSFDGSNCTQVLQLYKDTMHANGPGGCTWYMPVKHSKLVASGLDGFGGAYDVMFIGTVKRNAFDDNAGEGVWFGKASPSWAVGFLSTMSPESATMFLAAVHGRLLTNTWDYFHTVVNNGKYGRAELGKLGASVSKSPLAGAP